MKQLIGALIGLVLTSCYTTQPGEESASAVKDFETPAVYLTTTPFPEANAEEFQVCSFNIKFLGFYLDKKNAELIDLIKACDIVLIQELVATPRDVRFRYGWPRRLQADPEAKQFAEMMQERGFSMWVSNEDTGKNSNRSNDSDSEWKIAFYRSSKVTLDRHRSGFIDRRLVNNPTFDRVPYAFAFRASRPGGTDFVLINAHLASDKNDDERRRGEFRAVKNWISQQMRQDGERDYFLIGDLNIQSAAEFQGFITAPPASLRMQSLNAACQGTNIRKENPYDHVIYSPEYSTEVVPELHMVDIGEVFAFLAEFSDVRVFSPFYSDHFPIAFKVRNQRDDD